MFVLKLNKYVNGTEQWIFTSMIQGARLPRLPKAKTDCALGTECLLRNFQSVITQCLHQISNAL